MSWFAFELACVNIAFTHISSYRYSVFSWKAQAPETCLQKPTSGTIGSQHAIPPGSKPTPIFADSVVVAAQWLLCSLSISASLHIRDMR
eukprot:4507008-Amphidinium_carterae.2